MGQPPVTVASNAPTFGATERGDWEDAPVSLSRGTSIVAQLHARGIPATRDILAAIAQANGIADFRHISAETPVWLPRRESIMGERAAAWRDAYRSITPDSFAVVDRDRQARRAVQGRAAQRPLLPAPGYGPVTREQPMHGPRPAGAAQPAQLTPIGGAAAPPGPDIEGEEQDEQAPAPTVIGAEQPGPLPPDPQVLRDLSAQGAPVTGAAPVAPPPSASAADQQAPTPSPSPNAAPPPSQTQPEPPPLSPQQRLGKTVIELRDQLRGKHNADAILRLTYDLMSNPHWTNETARLAYAEAVGSKDPWQIIRDIHASGLDDRQSLIASEYVWNDETTPYRGQISPPVRAALAAVGFKSRIPWDSAHGTADGTMEDALWDIVNGMGLAQANAIFASRAGAKAGGGYSNIRLPVDPDNMPLAGRIAAFLDSSRRPAPLDGHIEPAPPGSNPLEHMIRTEKNPWMNPLGGFSSGPRDKWLAILKMPQDMDRGSFEVAAAAHDATGAQFLKLFEGKTAEQMSQISTAYRLGFGDGHSLAEHAGQILKPNEFKLFEALAHGVRSNKQSAAAYVALALREHKGDAKALKDVLTRNLGSARYSNGPTWNDVVTADYQMDPRRADAEPLASLVSVGDLAKDPVLDVIIRDQDSPDEPAGLARRIMASTNPKEITQLLRRSDGEYFNEQELTIMAQRAAQIAGVDANAQPSALYKHVVDVCGGTQSEAAVIAQRVSGMPSDLPAFDENGALAPAARLFFALRRGDQDEVVSVLASTRFADLGPLEANYPKIAAALSQPNMPPPGGTADPRAAIEALLTGDNRTRALQFLTGMNVTSREAAKATGDQLAQRVTDDLASRWPWILKQFDHEREPLRERLMQFKVTLAQVLDDVKARSAVPGQAPGLTEQEQMRLGLAVAALINQQHAFGIDRDETAATLQNATIIIATAVASLALTASTAGAGAPAAAALMAAATNVGRFAAVGAAAGLATAPLMGGHAKDYLYGGLKGISYGGFVGLMRSGALAQSALSPIFRGDGWMSATAKQAVWNGVALGGLYTSFNIGVHFDSTGDAAKKFAHDFMVGALWGGGIGAMRGLSLWMFQYADKLDAAASAEMRAAGGAQYVQQQVAQNLTAYANTRDLATMERAFANLTSGQLPDGPIQMDQVSRSLFARGMANQLQAMANTPIRSQADWVNQTRWVTTISLYSNAAGIQLPQEALGNAVTVMRNVGYQGLPAQLTAQTAQQTLTQFAQQYMTQTLPIQPPPAVMNAARAAAAPPRTAPVQASGGPRPAGAAERGISLSHGDISMVSRYRSWNAIALKARTPVRAASLDEAVRAREELTALQTMMSTPQGPSSIVAMRNELGGIGPQELAGIRRSYSVAIARLDEQIADSVRRDAAALVNKPVPAGNPGEIYTRLVKLEGYRNLLTTLRTHGAALETVSSAAPAVQSAEAKLMAQLPRSAKAA